MSICHGRSPFCMSAKKVNSGIIVTFGNFTQDAKEFAKDKSIDLIDGNRLVRLISEVQKSGRISAAE